MRLATSFLLALSFFGLARSLDPSSACLKECDTEITTCELSCNKKEGGCFYYCSAKKAICVDKCGNGNVNSLLFVDEAEELAETTISRFEDGISPSLLEIELPQAPDDEPCIQNCTQSAETCIKGCDKAKDSLFCVATCVFDRLPGCVTSCAQHNTTSVPELETSRNPNPGIEHKKQDRCKTWCDLVGRNCLENCGLNIFCLAGCLFNKIPQCIASCPPPPPHNETSMLVSEKNANYTPTPTPTPSPPSKEDRCTKLCEQEGLKCSDSCGWNPFCHWKCLFRTMPKCAEDCMASVSCIF
ncbi:hypothetical protein HYFRA_00013437 [Hymenoscyphus fraxineus]|uniref:Uncharacterized protein n=1 Tax=Hymenoscyphus fraxineus TaxID=746836 RepID=A0A9N9L7T6_9HELO|nr:hypothetical protein HYFRA_00013437 [Hymenoscyphus fraxineus]